MTRRGTLRRLSPWLRTGAFFRSNHEWSARAKNLCSVLKKLACAAGLMLGLFAATAQGCTAGSAAFITGQSPIRIGLTKVGLPGAEEEPENPDYFKNPELKKKFGRARRDPQLCQRAHHRHRPAGERAHGDHRRGGSTPRRWTSWSARSRPTSPSSCGGTPPACTSSRTLRRRPRARPAWASMPTAWSSTMATWWACCSTSSRRWAWTRTPSPCTRPTMAQRPSPGPAAARPCFAARRTRSGRAATACPH